MTPGEQPRRRESAFALVRRLVSGTVSLAKLEIQRGRQEVGETIGQLRGGIVLVAVGAAILVLFLILVPAFIISVLVTLGLWWVALILLVVLLAIAILLAVLGIRRVRSVSFVPEETIASVKEDVEWAKRLLRRE